MWRGKVRTWVTKKTLALVLSYIIELHSSTSKCETDSETDKREFYFLSSNCLKCLARYWIKLSILKAWLGDGPLWSEVAEAPSGRGSDVRMCSSNESLGDNAPLSA